MTDVVMSSPDSSPASKPNPSSTPAVRTASAAVIDPADADSPPYAMFDLAQLSVAGAFLTGSVFFERGEEFLVQLSRGASPSVRVRARVVDHTRSPEAGMTIEFVNLTDAERSALSALSAAGE
jgi:hypothetical protein